MLRVSSCILDLNGCEASRRVFGLVPSVTALGCLSGFMINSVWVGKVRVCPTKKLLLQLFRISMEPLI